MAPLIPCVKTATSYPVFAADFDPSDDRLLLVGGGGGEGRSGVSNKLTLLATSSPTSLTKLAELELSSQEDAVTSLSIEKLEGKSSPRGDRSARAWAGINSSTESQQAGTNEHLRSFDLRYPAPALYENIAVAGASEKDGKARITPEARESLFTPSTAARKETYQRVLRVASSSRENSVHRIAAVATGLAPEGEIVVFDPQRPAGEKERGRINLGKGEEGNDVDITPTDSGYQVAYCTDFDVSLYSFNARKEPMKPLSSTKSNPRCIYSTPFPDVFTAGTPRPKFRSLRFLTPSLVLLLSNRASRAGSELSVLRFGDGLGEIVRTTRLHRSLKAAVSLDVSVLSRDGDEDKQFVIAVAGQDISIELLILDYSPRAEISKLRPYTVLREVHPLQITKVVFSHSSTGALARNVPDTLQHLRLASVSMGNTVVVHTLPLVKTVNKRAVLVAPSARKPYYLAFSVMITILLALLMQSYFELHSQSPRRFQVADLLSPQVRNMLGPAYPPPSAEFPVPSPTPPRLRDLVHEGREQAKILLVQDTEEGLATEMHHPEVVESQGKRWDELKEHEKEYWRDKLSSAGHWVAHEGETVLKGIFFSEVAGLAAQAARG
ncbi:MAG: hypothetical protein M1817_006366 [Caeruleum heppii]|nr:MAG: hypothetical protein M1817_006366 [Caeruleum heppii]